MEKMKSAAYSPRTDKSSNVGTSIKKETKEKVLTNVTFDDKGKVIKQNQVKIEKLPDITGQPA